MCVSVCVCVCVCVFVQDTLKSKPQSKGMLINAHIFPE